MATENDEDIRDNGVLDDTAKADKSERTERTEREPREAKEPAEDKPKSIRETIKSAIKEHTPPKVGRPRKDANPEGEETPAKEAVADKAAPKAGKEIPAKEAVEKATRETAPQAPVTDAPPAALSKEVRDLWQNLDPLVRKEFLRREADTSKGVEQLKARYQPIDEAIHPLRDELRAIGKTEAEGVRMLADWRNALRGPHKVQAFRALAQAEGIDLTQLVSHAPNSQGAPQQTQNPNDPASILRPFIDPISQKVTSLEAELQRRDAERVQADIRAFSNDKPHFERVKVAMGYMIQNGLVPGADPKEVFEEAYRRACRADPEVFAAIQAEEQSKRAEEAKAAQEAAERQRAADEAERKRKEAEALEKARKAAVGPRNGSPAGMARANPAKDQSVRASIEKALKEVRGSI